MRTLTPLTILLFLAFPATAADMEWVNVSGDHKGFVLAESGQPFIPWRFKCDHEGDGKLLEDYWDDQWPTVESAFRVMKGFGVVSASLHDGLAGGGVNWRSILHSTWRTTDGSEDEGPEGGVSAGGEAAV